MSRKLQLDSAIAADIQTVNADSYIDSLKMIDIENIEPNRNNFYENSEIEALADDIERQGLMTALASMSLSADTDGLLLSSPLSQTGAGEAAKSPVSSRAQSRIPKPNLTS